MKHMMKPVTVLVAVLLLVSVGLMACGGDDETSPQPSATETETSGPALTEEPSVEPTPDEQHPNEPPTNPYMADSPWAGPHRNSYCQGSSPHPGPTEPLLEQDFLLGRPALVTANFSSPYPDGGRVIWASSYGEVVKIDPEGETLEYIDRIESYPVLWPDALGEQLMEMSCKEAADFLVPLIPPDPELREGELPVGSSGIYPVLGSDGIFY